MDNTTNTELIEKLYAGGGLCAEEYEQLIAAHPAGGSASILIRRRSAR